MIRAFFEKLYASPAGRIGRRLVVAGAAAVASWLLASGKIVLTPEGLVDSVLALTRADVVMALKLFVGAGVLAAADKMRREVVWSWAEKPAPADVPPESER